MGTLPQLIVMKRFATLQQFGAKNLGEAGRVAFSLRVAMAGVLKVCYKARLTLRRRCLAARCERATFNG